MKKFWKYFTIVILLLIGLFFVGLLYLFFVPNSHLFNITYISKNETKVLDNDYKADDIDKISLVSRNYNVKVVSTDSDEITLKVYANSLGFVLRQNKDLSITPTPDGRHLTISVSEPHGFATMGESYIELYLPESKSFDMAIKNNKAYTNIDSENLSINNLSYTANDGMFDIDAGRICGMLDLDLNKSTFNIGKDVSTATNEVILRVTSGKFNAVHSTLGKVSIAHNTRGVILIKECGTIIEDIDVAGGRIEIEKASHTNIKTSDTNVKINTITDGAIIELTSGNITIDDLTGELSDIETTSGNINLNKTHSAVILESTNGNITVSNARNAITVNTKRGHIDITFADDAINRSVSSSRLVHGKITVKNVDYVNIKTDENKSNCDVSMDILMRDVNGDCVVKGDTGSVKVVVEYSADYILSTISDKGNVNVNLMQTTEYGGYDTKSFTTTNVNIDQSLKTYDHTLQVSTKSGSLQVYDTKLA